MPDNYESACLIRHYFADRSNDGQHNDILKASSSSVLFDKMTIALYGREHNN